MNFKRLEKKKKKGKCSMTGIKFEVHVKIHFCEFALNDYLFSER